MSGARQKLKSLRVRWGSPEISKTPPKTIEVNGMGDVEVWRLRDDGTKGEDTTYELETTKGDS